MKNLGMDCSRPKWSRDKKRGEKKKKIQQFTNTYTHFFLYAIVLLYAT